MLRTDITKFPFPKDDQIEIPTETIPLMSSPLIPSPLISSLSQEEFDEFLDIRMELMPKNIKLELDYDSEPVITVIFLAKFFFRSLTDTKKAECENPLHPANFTKCHLIPVPTIQSLNGRPVKNTNDEPIIKKLKPPEKDDEQLKGLTEKAFNHDNDNDSDKPEFKVENFQATQRYQFQVPIMKWSTAAKNFPVDVHMVRFDFSLKPILAYTDEPKTTYELMIPGRKSKGKKLPVKENFYPNIKVKKFPHNADTKVEETILEFDIQPNSMKLYETSRKNPVTRKTTFVLTFMLVRHVLGPALTALAPIYVIAFLTPFACFFELNGVFDGIAGYLVTLLLALVAHRIVITEAQTAIQKFTISDCDFAICILVIVLQMIIFMVLIKSQKFTTDNIMTMIQLELQPHEVLFAIEESIILLWILLRIIGIVRAYNRLVNQNEVDLLETNEGISINDYRQLREDRKLLERELAHTVYLKSLFSINMKIMLKNILQDEVTTYYPHSVNATLPTNDVFRCRLYQNKKACPVLVKIQENSKFKPLYTKKIEFPNREKNQSAKGAAKCVYTYTPSRGRTLLLEVQFLLSYNVFTVESHCEYKKRRMKEFLKKLPQDPGPILHKKSVVKMYLRSLWVEIFSTSKHNFFSNCASDWRLLCLTWRLLEDLKPQIPIFVEDQGTLEEKASEQIQNLLDTGDFNTPLPGA